VKTTIAHDTLSVNVLLNSSIKNKLINSFFCKKNIQLKFAYATEIIRRHRENITALPREM